MRGGRPHEGGVFSDRIEGGRAGAQIELAPSALVATTRDGETFELPLGAASLELGGASGRMVFCRDATRSLTLFTEDAELLQRLVEAGPAPVRQQATALQRALRRRRASRWVAWGAALAILGGLAVGAPRLFGLVADSAVGAIPYSVDEKVGAMAIESMDLGGPEIADRTLRDAVNAIVNRLAPYRSREATTFEVRVVRRDVANAFALPGGHIVLYSGLIRRAESAEEVAGVLAHEMAHVTERHGLERMAKAVGVVGAVQMLLGDAGGVVALGAELFTVAAVNQYSRGQEAEADREAVRMLVQARIDPAGLIRFFSMLEDEAGDAPAGLSWLGTHPRLDQRIDQMRAARQRMGAFDAEPLEIDWGAVRRALAATAPSPPPPASPSRPPATPPQTVGRPLTQHGASAPVRLRARDGGLHRPISEELAP